MSSWQVKVSCGGKVIKELDQETYDDILFDLSWWKVDTTGAGEQSLVIFLAKASHRAWAGPWFLGGMNPHKKIAFAWSNEQVGQSIIKELKVGSQALRSMEPGEPEDWNHEISTAITAEQMCTGMDLFESETSVQIVIHLDEAALDGATARVPLEEVFAADITRDQVVIFLRGDGFVIFKGKLNGSINQAQTTWKIRNIRRKNLPQDSDIKVPAFFNPALCIKLQKEGQPRLWQEIFAESQSTSFSLPRERIPWEERVARCQVLSPGAHTDKARKAERAQDLCTKVECSQDLLLNRVIIHLHLEERLTAMCQKFKVGLDGLFSMKVGPRMIQVNFVADAEYSICMGGLGGECIPEASSWEIFIDGNEEDGIAPHAVLKLGLAKSERNRGRWAEVFTRWQPWQVSENLKQAMKDGPADELEDFGDLDLEDADMEGNGE